jgi:hypothetical protein
MRSPDKLALWKCGSDLWISFFEAFSVHLPGTCQFNAKCKFDMDAQQLHIACHVLAMSEENTCMVSVCLTVFIGCQMQGKMPAQSNALNIHVCIFK